MSYEKGLRPKRIKIEKNLYRVGVSYYYRRGDFEESLGVFPSDKKAIEYKAVYEMKRDTVGAIAYRFKVKDVWPDYVAFRKREFEGTIEKRRKISKKTYQECIHLWHKFFKGFFANKRIADLDDILWAEYCRKAKVADLTNHRKVLKHFLKWCIQMGYARMLPIFAVPPIVRRKRKTLTPEQMKLVLKHSEGPQLLFVSLYLLMGVRRGEQVQLAWENIDFENMAVLIQEETSRTRKGRVVPLNPFVRDQLVSIWNAQRAQGLVTPWVFPKARKPSEHATADGKSKAWNTMIRNAGLVDAGLEPHDLRATYEHYANKRTDFTDTQREKMAGASIQTQRRIYLHGFQAEDLRGLENVVQFDGLESIMSEKNSVSSNLEAGGNTGKTENVRKKK